MDATLIRRHAGEVTIIDLSGRIILGEASRNLREQIRELLAMDNKKILLNLGAVSYVDSAGLGELVSGLTAVTKAGGQLKILNLSKRIKGLMQLTKLYTVFEVFEDEPSAVRSFS